MGFFNDLGGAFAGVASGPSGYGGGKYVKGLFEEQGPGFFNSDAYQTMQKLRPDFQSLTGSNGKLKPNYTLNTPASMMPELNTRLDGIQLDKRGLEALRTEGLRTGESAWGSLMKQQQGLEEQGLLDTAARNAQTAESQGFSALARRGGTSAGARERMAQQTASNLLRTRQGVAGEGAKARAGIAVQDESNRLDILKGLPAAELAAIQPDLQKTSAWANMLDSENSRAFDAAKYNTENTIGERDKKAAYDLAKYQETMKAWGADRTADAQAKAGKSGKK